MKKLVSLLTTSAILCSLSAPALASGITNSMSAVEADHSSINIIYNGQLMTYTDAVPENINDRIMLPFRAVLESMGAVVDYDDASRLVTATRDDITITFTLEDDTIYIDKNGEKSQITLDVPMIIKNDRTLVPIRFISNSLGMQVGWDGNYQTVFIVDTNSYINQLTSNAPNLMAVSEKNNYVYNTNALDLSLKLNVNDGSNANSVSADMSLDSKTADGVSSVSGTVSADLNGWEINAVSVKDAAVDIVAADGRLYFKTDLAQKLLEGNQENSKIKLIAETLTGEHWFYIEVDKLIDTVLSGYPESAKSIYKQILNGDIQKNMSIADMVNKMISTDGDATLTSAIQADVMIDAYTAIDKYITVTDNSVEMKLNNDTLREILRSSNVPEELIAQMLNLITMDIDASTNYSDSQADSKVTMTIGFNNGGNSTNLSLDLTQISKQEENVVPAEVPESAIDFVNLIDLIK